MKVKDLKELLTNYDDNLDIDFEIIILDETGNIIQESIEEASKVIYIKDLIGNEENSLRFEIYVTKPEEEE